MRSREKGGNKRRMRPQGKFGVMAFALLAFQTLVFSVYFLYEKRMPFFYFYGLTLLASGAIMFYLYSKVIKPSNQLTACIVDISKRNGTKPSEHATITDARIRALADDLRKTVDKPKLTIAANMNLAIKVAAGSAQMAKRIKGTAESAKKQNELRTSSFISATRRVPP